MGPAPRLVALWGVLAVFAAGAGAWLADGPSPHERPRAALPGAAPSPLVRVTTYALVRRPPAKRHVRRPRMPRGHDARAVLRRALLRGRIARRDWHRWRATLLRSRLAVRRLTGARRAELHTVLAGVEAMAASGRLTPSRMRLAFLTLRRNTTVWRFRPFPHPGERMTFGRDPAVFQFFPGHGVQFHALATAGRANAIAVPCLAASLAVRARAGRRAERAAVRRRAGLRALRRPARRRGLAARPGCHPRVLQRRLDRLLALSSSRGGFTAWEYAFAYGGGAPYWISAMSQATAAQALARGAEVLGRADYRRAALSALGAFRRPVPVGVAAGGQYVMYSFAPGLRILNGFLQSLIGLHDVAELTGSGRAEQLFRRGERSARQAVAAYDTGAWSRYSLGGRESTLPYHELVTGFLAGLCTRTARPVYCRTGARFARYEREPPRIDLAVSRRPRAGRSAALSFALSKVSAVAVSVRGRHGRVLRIDTQLPRGRWRYAWTPPRRGRYVVVVRAIGPEGRRAVVRDRVLARAPTRRRSGAGSAPRARRAASPW